MVAAKKGYGFYGVNLSKALRAYKEAGRRLRESENLDWITRCKAENTIFLWYGGFVVLLMLVGVFITVLDAVLG